jgi:hypothetical protein
MSLPRFAAVAPFALSSILLATPCAADEGLTTRSGVVPLSEEGRLTACQAPFEAVRGDPEYSGGRRVRVEGRLLVVGPANAQAGVIVELSIHGPDDAADAPGESPADLELRSAGRSSAAERFTGEGSASDDGRRFIFTFGPVTRAVLRGAMQDGRFTLAYAKTAGGPLAPLTIDLTVKHRNFGGAGDQDPGAPQALSDCLRRLRLAPVIQVE